MRITRRRYTASWSSNLEEPWRGSLKPLKVMYDFSSDNNPYGEHDFGSFEIDGHKLFWKIDYYALDMMHGSEDAANPDITTRVLTIMLTEEY